MSPQGPRLSDLNTPWRNVPFSVPRGPQGRPEGTPSRLTSAGPAVRSPSGSSGIPEPSGSAAQTPPWTPWSWGTGPEAGAC